MQKNVIECNGIVLRINKKQLPFGNEFRQLSSKESVYCGQKEIHALVECTLNSLEPGRQYSCLYNLQGQLESCITVN